MDLTDDLINKNTPKVIDEFQLDDDEGIEEININDLSCSIVSNDLPFDKSIRSQTSTSSVNDLLNDHNSTIDTTINNSSNLDDSIVLEPQLNHIKKEIKEEIKTEIKTEIKNEDNPKLIELTDNADGEINYQVVNDLKEEQQFTEKYKLIKIEQPQQEELKVPPIKVKIISSSQQNQSTVTSPTIKKSIGTTKPTIQTINPVVIKKATVTIENIPKLVIKNSLASLKPTDTEQSTKVSIIKSNEQVDETPKNLCLKSGCKNKSVKNEDWDDFCSAECLIDHCRRCFVDWVNNRKNSQKNN